VGSSRRRAAHPQLLRRGSVALVAPSPSVTAPPGRISPARIWPSRCGRSTASSTSRAASPSTPGDVISTSSWPDSPTGPRWPRNGRWAAAQWLGSSSRARWHGRLALFRVPGRRSWRRISDDPSIYPSGMLTAFVARQLRCTSRW